jgi:hypothetical protein
MRERGQRRVEHLLKHPDVHRFAQTAATAVRSAVASFETASDEAHDTLEEQLARLVNWPYMLVGYLFPTRPPSALRR